MKKTKHPYLKEILKTTAKVALMAAGTLVAIPCAFGFFGRLFNIMAVGSIAGWITLGVGTLLTARTLIKDIVTMRKRVEKQRQEERLERLREELQKLREEHKHSAAHQTQKELAQKPEYTEKDIKAKRLKFLRGWIERRRLAQKEKNAENKRLNLRWLRNKREDNSRAA